MTVINATPETVRAVTQVFKLAGILDDRVAQPDKHRIVAWAEQIQRHRLIEGDLLDGLQAYYDAPSDRAIQIGDLIHHARYARRSRLEREAEAEAEQRYARNDAKAEREEMRQISAAFISGRVNDTPRLKAAREALEDCRGKAECKAAIEEFLAAKSEAKRPRSRKVSS